jgi:hypothetical protein
VRAFVAAAREAGRVLEPEPDALATAADAPYDWQEEGP